MRAAFPALLLVVGACASAPTSEAESENAIAERAAEIRNQADADVARQVQEIEAASNAEAAEIGATMVNAQ